MEERRRSSRIGIDAAELVLLPLVATVRVLDIGAGGVLLESPRQPQLGSRGKLTLMLLGEPVSVEVEVQRVSPINDPQADGRCCVAATFVSVSPELRRVIERSITV